MDSTWVADERGDSAVTPPAGDCIILRRSLASVLFGAAFCVGVPSACMLVTILFQGTRSVPSPWSGALVGVGIGWTLGWLARLLWVGHPIPAWFMATVLIVPAAGACVLMLVKRDAENGLYAFGLLVYLCWQIRSGLFAPQKKTVPEL